ncbi:L-lactate permease [Clostridium sp. SY8519]|uniref:L-lactate permease n=1 Tax=Clostridium sp. (strain SY8519) TaxID=1042156 RepID=UPI0002171D10|nr:lactate permease LctP family transporter [Clostridium sp. SY8519]BAK47698.1 L-lactate permease [Clostridium sp. SY8519]
MLFVKFILALIPIIWLIVALSGIKMAGFKACVIALVIAAIEAVAIPFWHMRPVDAASAALEGTLNALWPIILVIIAALFTYNLTLETKAMDSIKKMLASVSMDQRILMLIIGWGFGNFMEGMAGFGTAVAIPAGIMVALGFNPILTVVACFVINTTPTAFGSVGVPTATLATVTGLDVGTLAANTAVIELILMFLSPFIAICILGKGFKALKGVFGITVISSLAFVAPAVLTAFGIGAELPNIIGSIVCMVVTILLGVKTKNRPVPDEYRVLKKVPESGEGAAAAEEHFDVKEGIKAWSPFVLIFIFLLCTSKIIPFINGPLSSIKSSFQIYTGTGDPLGFTWINTPGVIIFIAAIIGGLIQGASFGTMGRVFVKTVKSNWKTIVTICAVLATAKVMSHSGMTSDIAGLLEKSGNFFPLVSPLIGVIGAFVTGSGTSTTVLFGDMQRQTAEAIGANPYWLATANTMGAGIGKMISPQGLAIGAAAIGMSGQESKLMSATAKYCVLCVIIACLCTYLLPMLGVQIG